MFVSQAFPLYVIPADLERDWGISIVVGWECPEDYWLPTTVQLTGPYLGQVYASTETIKWLFFTSKEDAEAALLAR